jgi:hypothetical protein
VCVHLDSLVLHCIVCCDDYTTTPAGVETDETAAEAETVARSVPRLLDCGHTFCHAVWSIWPLDVTRPMVSKSPIVMEKKEEGW